MGITVYRNWKVFHYTNNYINTFKADENYNSPV